MRSASLILAVLLLAGCDKLTGAAEQKTADAEAIGYACRISQKTPEACMKENEAQSPSAVLDGWKSADKDIKEKAIDISMGGAGTPTTDEKAAGGDAPAEDEKPAAAEGKDGKPADAAKDGAKDTQDKGSHK